MFSFIKIKCKLSIWVSETSKMNISNTFWKYTPIVLLSWFIFHLSILSNSLTDGQVSCDAQAKCVGLGKKIFDFDYQNLETEWRNT